MFPAAEYVLLMDFVPVDDKRYRSERLPGTGSFTCVTRLWSLDKIRVALFVRVFVVCQVCVPQLLLVGGGPG